MAFRITPTAVTFKLTTPAAPVVFRLNGVTFLGSGTGGASVNADIKEVADTGYALVAGDAGKYLRFTANSAVALVVPSDAEADLPIGFQVMPYQGGTGTVSFAPTPGVTINTNGDLALRGQNSSGALVKVGPNSWDLVGDLAGDLPTGGGTGTASFASLTGQPGDNTALAAALAGKAALTGGNTFAGDQNFGAGHLTTTGDTTSRAHFGNYVNLKPQSANDYHGIYARKVDGTANEVSIGFGPGDAKFVSTYGDGFFARNWLDNVEYFRANATTVELRSNNAIKLATKSTGVDVTGNLIVSGNISAANLSGTNTGDQDLSGLATTAALTSGLAGKQNSNANLTSLAALTTSGNAGLVIKVNAAGNGFELATDLSAAGGAAAWGGITGTLSNQTDLQNALNAKATLNAANTFTGGQTVNQNSQTNVAALTLSNIGLGTSGVHTTYSAGGFADFLHVADNKRIGLISTNRGQMFQAISNAYDDSGKAFEFLNSGADARHILAAKHVDATGTGDFFRALDSSDTAKLRITSAGGIIATGTINAAALQVSGTNVSLAGHSHIIGDVTGLQAALDAKADDSDLANYATTTALSTGLAGKANTSHTHAIADTTGLQAALDGKQAAGSYAAAAHTHTIANVTGLQTALDGKQAAGSYQTQSTNLTSLAALAATSGNAGLTIKVSASGGFELATDISAVGGGGAATWGSISGTLSSQTDLQSALNAKANSTHTHAIADVTGLQTALDGKQAAGSYAAASHTHVIADTTGLQAALDGKQAAGSYAAATHTHAFTDINNVSTGTLFYRKTAGTGAAELQTLATLKTDLAITKADVGLSNVTNTAQQPLDGDLTAIAALTGTGILKRTGTDTWTLDTTAYQPAGSYAAATHTHAVADINNVTTGTLFYRKTAGTGAAELQTLATLKTDLALTKSDVGLSNVTNVAQQPLDADLTAIAGLAGTTGFLKKTAADTWALDTASYQPAGSYAAASHTHAIADVTGLQGALDAKQPAGSYQTQSANLTSIAGLTATGNVGKVIKVNGTGNGFVLADELGGSNSDFISPSYLYFQSGPDGDFTFCSDDGDTTVLELSPTFNRVSLGSTGTHTLRVGAVNIFKANTAGVSVIGTLNATAAVTGSNLSGTNTGDETYSTITAKLAGGSGGGTANFLRADGTFAAPPAGGGASSWGSITGTLSSQTDLQNALNAKAPLASPVFTGTVTAPVLNSPDGFELQSNGATRFKSSTFGVDLVGQSSSVSVSLKTSDDWIRGSITASSTNVIYSANKNLSLSADEDESGTAAIKLQLGFNDKVVVNNAGMTVTGSLAATNFSGSSSGTNTGDETKSTIDTKLGVDGSTTLFYRKDGTWAAPPAGGSSSWGSITGTLSSQTDLQNALNGKLDTSHAGSGGTAHADATTSVSGFMSAADKTKLNGIATGATANTGTVTTVSVTSANGISGTVTNASTAPAISLSLGAITPSSVTSNTLTSAASTTLGVTGTAGVDINVGTGTLALVAKASGNTGMVLNSGAGTNTYLDVNQGGTYRGWFGFSNSTGLGIYAQGTAFLNGATGSFMGHNGATKLGTNASGIDVTGTLAVSGNISAANHLTTMSGFCSGKPASLEDVAGAIFPVATTITQANCQATAVDAATASTVFTIKRQSNGATVGTLTFAAAAKLATVSITSGAVTAGEMLYIEAPSTADATLGNIAFLVRA